MSANLVRTFAAREAAAGNEARTLAGRQDNGPAYLNAINRRNRYRRILPYLRQRTQRNNGG